MFKEIAKKLEANRENLPEIAYKTGISLTTLYKIIKDPNKGAHTRTHKVLTDYFKKVKK